MAQEMILVLDFGGQYNQLIARRVRELSVYSEVHPHTLSIEEIKKMNPTGIILTGGPATVYEDDAPKCSKELFELGIPVLRCLEETHHQDHRGCSRIPYHGFVSIVPRRCCF